MTKARDLGKLVSQGQLLADGVVQASEISGLSTVATSGSYADLTNKPTIPTVPTLATVATTGNYADLTNKPTLAGVATSGSYADLTNKPTIPTVPTLATVATTGSYNDLADKPTGLGGGGVTNYNDLTNKPTLATVATTGSYVDLTNKPTIPTLPTLATVATSGSYTDLTNKPTIPSGSYTDLTNKPTIPSGSYTDLTDKPTFASVATSGSYADLTNKPTIPTLPTLATVATTGSYTDLTNKPVVATLKVSSIAYPGDDLAANPVGGQTITLTGTGFTAGLSVLVNTTMAAVVTVVSSTTVTFTAPAMAAGTYVLYLVATDGSVALSLPGISYSGVPAWSTTAGTLGTQYETSAISKSLSATSTDGAVTYSLVSGALPPGSSLNTSTGAISGTAPATNSSTTYNFTIRATDAQNQDTDRSFSITLDPDNVTWSSPSDNISLTAAPGSAYSQVFTATSIANNSISYSSNQLPAGITLSGSTLTGTFTTEQNIVSTVTATAANTSRAATRTVTFTITAPGEPFFKNVALLLTGTPPASQSKTFTVTNSGASDYLINGSGDPTITLVRGSTYTFNVNATGHPFWIKTSQVTGTGSGYSSGVTNNGTQSGTVTFVVPNDAPNTLYYICQFHGSMTGTINIIDANNNVFLDSSANNFTITRNGNTSQGSFSPYGLNWSNHFDGTGDYLSVPANSAFNLGTGDFTVECWVYRNTSTTGYETMLGFDTTGGLLFEIYQNELDFGVRGTANVLGSGVIVPSNQWVHLAITRQSGVVRYFQNGILTYTYSGTYATYNFTNNTPALISGYSIPGGQLNGYISNLRLVNGTALYTSTFTPSTTPLTAVSGTSLLTCQSNRFADASANNFVVTKFGDSTVHRFNPFGASSNAVYSANVIGGSAYFDGTGDYLTLPYNQALNFGSSDFTIEFWAYWNNVAAATSIYIPFSSPYGQIAIASLPGSTTTLRVFLGTTANSWDIVSGASIGTISAGAWHHVAVTRSGSNFRTFLNGVLGGTATSASALYSATQTVTIGYDPSQSGSGGYPLNGYLSDFRINNSTALYSANFTPPTAPLTAPSGTTCLLNMTNAAIFDSAMINNLETVGNAQISTSVKKFGTGSLAFDGTDDYLSTPSTPNLALGSGDFTIECWVYANSLGSYNALLAQWPDNGGTVNNSYVLESVGSDMRFYWVSGTTLYGPATLGSIETGSWIHYAISRQGSTLFPFKNGICGTTVSISQTLNSPTSPITIGGQVAGAGYWNGYIDDLRVTKGYNRYPGASANASNTTSTTTRGTPIADAFSTSGYFIFGTWTAGNYLTVDFGSSVNSVTTTYKNNIGVGWAPSSVLIQTSNDNSSWTTVVNHTDANNTSLQTIASSGSGRYWRMYQNSTTRQNTDGYQWHFNNFSMTATPGFTPPTEAFKLK